MAGNRYVKFDEEIIHIYIPTHCTYIQNIPPKNVHVIMGNCAQYLQSLMFCTMQQWKWFFKDLKYPAASAVIIIIIIISIIYSINIGQIITVVNLLFSNLNHLLLLVESSFHYWSSETNCEDIIPIVCPCVCFTATPTGRVYVIFPIDSRVKMLLWVKNGEQITLYMKT
jgi:hypothetical protein